MSIVASPTENTVKVEPTVKADLREEMIKSLKEESTEAAEEEDVKETPKAEASNEDDSESEDSEESEESEEEKTEDSDKPKKPNRYQRIKAKVEEAQALARKHANDLDEAVKIANLYRTRYLALDERLKRELAQAEQVGYKVSPESEENYRLRSALQEKELEAKVSAHQAEERVKQEVAAEKQVMVDEFTEQALSLASKLGFQGNEGKNFARKVLLGYSANLSAGEEVSMVEVAQTLAAVSQQRKHASQTKAQLEVNSGAPKRIKTHSGGIAPDYPATREGMISFLKSMNG